ncbi:PAS domain-containing protein [Thauera sinica]|uniref:PAS domain-containing protein n=1 Tax=Thauera sinica TaxID=2665146 RepID=A0ABW1AR04_9RHOO|nr:PAS domain-containing protein [Thauera sp. K11]ATE59711.1 aerotaxis receptor Aer [Thauera sp. K11]
MKNKITPTSIEVPLGGDDWIVSKTDLTGRITYVNRAFMRVSNYRESELLGEQHNIVRHPDMPRGIYRLLWETLKQEREFFGLAKNLTSDGHYYWVFANITADVDAAGQTVGYVSVRRQAPAAAVRAVVPLYAEMLRIEREGSAVAAPEASVAYLRQLLAGQHTTYDKFVLGLYQQ